MGRKKEGGGKRRKALDHDEPFRTCVACRTSRPTPEMLRFARAPDGAVGFDVRAQLPGRGAWTCASEACVRKAVDREAFQRAFDAPVIAKADELAAQVRATLTAEALAGLGMLRRTGTLAAGRDDVERALQGGAVGAVVVAADLSDRSKQDVAGMAPPLAVVPGPPMADIGAAIGREPTGIIGLPPGPRGERLVEDLMRLDALTRLAQGGLRA